MSEQASTVAIQKTEETNFGDLLKESFVNQPKEGSIAQGIVTEVQRSYILVDIGLKSEGLVDSKELGGEKFQIGDEIEVFVEQYEARDGKLKISFQRVLQEKSWIEVKKKFEADEKVEGEIVARVKGGFIVEINYLTAFLPGSQIDVKPLLDVSFLLGHKEEFKVLKMDETRGNIVVSRRAILESSHRAAMDKALEKIEEGQILEGVVKNITNYGAFIDLGAIDGLVHIADVSWSRISHPSEVLTVGEKVKVKIIKHDPIKKQVSLGIKQLKDDPWEKLVKNISVNSKIKGKITNINDYGVFVEFAKTVEGLVHISEITWSKGGVNPLKRVSLGQEVEVMVLEIDKNRHRVSLSIKRCQESPWVAFKNNCREGDVIEGTIVNSSSYAFYVNVAENLDGLLHFSDLSWENIDYKTLAANYKVGDKVKVKIQEINFEKEKLSLSIKNLTKNPYKGFEQTLAKNNNITVVVSKIRNDGINVTALDDLELFIKRSDLAKDRADQRSDRFAIGEKIDAKIVKFDKDYKKIILSIKALEIEEEKKVIKEYGSTSSGASLGDILGDALDANVVTKENNSNKGSE